MSEETDSPGIFVSVKKAIILSFVFGVVTGILLGVVATSITDNDELDSLEAELEDSPDGDLPSEDTEPSVDETGEQEPGTAEPDSDLDDINTELPYDVEVGFGSEDVEWDGNTVSLEGAPRLGDADADVTIVSYEDFFCPFCAAYNNQEVAQQLDANSAFGDIAENYIETGDVQYYFRQFPVVGGEISAEAHECVAEQEDSEAYWIFHHEHFSNFEQLRDLAETNPAEYESTMVEWSDQLGLDTEEYEQCLDEDRSQMEVSNQAQEGESLGAQATPTVFIDGETVEGAQPYTAFQTVIEDKLADAN